MPRKPRGTKGRMASPAQMERLRDLHLLGVERTTPLPFETYRDMIRKHRNPDSNAATEWAAWEHLERKAEDPESTAAIAAFSAALHEAALHEARATPPGDVIQ